LLFLAWGLSGNTSSKIPFAIPALIILIFTLRAMWRLAWRHYFWMTLGAFVLFGSVAYQEYLEFTSSGPGGLKAFESGSKKARSL
jgi:hypothetical protein